MKINSYKVTIVFNKAKNLTENRKFNFINSFKGYNCDFSKTTGIIDSDNIQIKIGVKLIEIILKNESDMTSNTIRHILKIMDYDDNNVVSVECGVRLDVTESDSSENLGKQMKMFSNIINLKINMLPLELDFLAKANNELVRVLVRTTDKGLKLEMLSLEDNLEEINNILSKLRNLSQSDLIEEIENVLLGDDMDGTKEK